MKRILSVSFFLISLFQFAGFPALSETLEFDPSLAITETYTDNLELDDTDPMEDWITLISPSLAARIATETGDLNVTVKPEYSLYTVNSEYNTLRLFCGLTGASRLSKHAEITFQNAFSRTEEPQSETEEIETDKTRRGREPFNTNTANLKAVYQFSKYGGVNAGYGYSVLDNEDPDMEDQQSHNPSAGLLYWIIPNKAGLSLQFSYLRTEFSDDSETSNNRMGSAAFIRRISEHLEYQVQYGHVYMTFSGETENYEVDEFMTTIDWRPARNIQFRGGCGFFQQTSEEKDSTSGLMGTLLLNRSYKHWRVQITGDAGYTQSRLESENLGFDWYYEGGGGLNWSVTRRMEFRFEGTYRHDTYEPEGMNRKDQLVQLAGRVNYEARQWLKAECGYEHRILNSNQDENDYAENRVEVRVSVFRPNPFRWLW